MSACWYLLSQHSQISQLFPPKSAPVCTVVFFSHWEKEMVAHSSILAWEISWTEVPGGQQSTGLQSQTRLSMHTTRYSVKYID